MDVAVAIGADPATMYSAILPLPPDLDEMMIAGFLRQSPVEMVKCQTCDLEVPANAEIVLEGYVELGELRTEGPFGDHTGFYSLADEYPVFHVTCITQRKDPIYATTIVGPPPMEDYYMGKAIERIFLPLMRLQLPEVRDIAMPAEGVFHNLILVSIRKSYPGHARKVMHAIWGTGPGDVLQVHRGGGRGCGRAERARGGLEGAEQHRPASATSSSCMGPVDSLDHCQPPAELRLEDGDRRHAQVARRRIHAPVAGRDRDVGGSEAAGGRAVEEGGAVGMRGAPSSRAMVCAALCTALALGWQALTVHYNYRGDWSALFDTGGYTAVPPSWARGTCTGSPAAPATTANTTTSWRMTRCSAGTRRAAWIIPGCAGGASCCRRLRFWRPAATASGWIPRTAWGCWRSSSWAPCGWPAGPRAPDGTRPGGWHFSWFRRWQSRSTGTPSTWPWRRSRSASSCTAKKALRGASSFSWPWLPWRAKPGRSQSRHLPCTRPYGKIGAAWHWRAPPPCRTPAGCGTWPGEPLPDQTVFASFLPFSGLLGRTLHPIQDSVATRWLFTAAILEYVAVLGMWVAVALAGMLLWKRQRDLGGDRGGAVHGGVCGFFGPAASLVGGLFVRQNHVAAVDLAGAGWVGVTLLDFPDAGCDDAPPHPVSAGAAMARDLARTGAVNRGFAGGEGRLIH